MTTHIINLLAVSMEIKKSAWLQNCTVKNLSLSQISNVFKLRLLPFLNSNPDISLNAFLNLTQNLLDNKEMVIAIINILANYYCIGIYPNFDY